MGKHGQDSEDTQKMKTQQDWLVEQTEMEAGREDQRVPEDCPLD